MCRPPTLLRASEGPPSKSEGLALPKLAKGERRRGTAGRKIFKSRPSGRDLIIFARNVKRERVLAKKEYAVDKTIFFDYGGVILLFHLDDFLEKTGRMFGVSAQQVLNFVRGGNATASPFWRGIELGQHEEKGIRDALCAHFGKEIPMDEFCRIFSSGIEPNDEYRRRPLFKKLRAVGVKLGAVSNINAIHARYVEKHLGFLLTDIPPWRRFYSFKLGVRKDSTGAALRRVCELCGIPPEQAILVDDLPENVEGMNVIGGKGLLFRGFHQLEYDLIQLGIIPR